MTQASAQITYSCALRTGTPMIGRTVHIGGDARGGPPSDDYAVRPSAACADATARSYVSLGG